MCKLALIIFVVAGIGIGIWITIGSEESGAHPGPSKFVPSTTSTTMDIVTADDSSIVPQLITIFIISIMLVYCFVSIRYALAEERKIWPADTVFVADSFLDSTPFVDEEEEEQSHGRIETLETEAEEVMNTKNGEDSEDQSKNKNLETNNFEMVVFTMANEEDDEENLISKVHDSSDEQFAENSTSLVGN
ncbi:hypothetical protein B9Z55_028598 [Caenorhabditis nigoni]|uniref:Uncharacterized protein n=1 Tax=Caenorhabditis nigoni TaxID=1611254 RepID=A0A2G5SB44_9PELO|nr:hypothetical protein B9Z55_028598 [Caenorhabditis nigoni]